MFGFGAVALVQVGFLSAGLWGASAAFRRRRWDPATSICAGLASVGVFAFFALVLSWTLLPHVENQVVVAVIACVLNVVLCVQAIRHGQWRDEISIPILLHLVFTLILIAWTFHGTDLSDPFSIAENRWRRGLPYDDQLPFLLAKAFQSGEVQSGFHAPDMADWLYSDRPPLQTAAYMLTPSFAVHGPRPWDYLTVGIALQMLSLVGAWALTAVFDARRLVTVSATVLVFFTPLAIQHGTFVWPKLLAAAYTLATLAVLVGSAPRQTVSTLCRGVLAGALLALAMLSHGGAAFAIMGIAVAVAVLVGRQVLPLLAPLVVAAGIIYAPWLAYQHLVNPPGDRLLKWHLAGAQDRDDRTLTEAFKDGYRALSLQQIFDVRAGNVRIFFDDFGPMSAHTIALLKTRLYESVDEGRQRGLVMDKQFFNVPSSIGPLGIIFFVLPFAALFSKATRVISISIIATLIVWISFMFRPFNAVVHQGAYFPELAAVVLSCLLLARLSRLALLGACTIEFLSAMVQFTP